MHPEYRGQGAAQLMLEWGIHKADERGMEMCVESVPFAVPIYNRFGFANVDMLIPDFLVQNPSPAWQSFSNDDLRVFLMWRPAGHNCRPGEDKAPWLKS